MAVLNARLLLVEDEPLDQALILERLRSASYLDVEVDIAASLAEAQRLLDLHTYDLVLLDYSLPDGTAPDLLGRLYPGGPEEALVSAKDGPDVLMVSGMDDLRVAARTLRAGAVDYLSKRALEGEELPRAVQAALVSRAHRAERARRAALEQQIQEYQAVLARSGAHRGTSELHAYEASVLHDYYGTFLRTTVTGSERQATSVEVLTNYVYQHQVPAEHLVRIHTRMIEELMRQEPMLAHRAVNWGRLALIRVLLALVQRYQRGET